MVEIFNTQGNRLPIISSNMSNGDSKLSEDRYEIYVNNDFVGYKTLYYASDSLGDVDDFLKTQGVRNFTTELDGDHYKIKAAESHQIKEILEVYCQNR
jgi:hypothetical protein